MAPETGSVVVEKHIAAPLDHVWQAFTNATAMREWMCDVASLVARVGGRVYLAWNEGFYAAGEFLEVQEKEKIAFSWLGRGDPGPTRVDVAFKPVEGGTLVRLTHSGFGADAPWPDFRKSFESEWQSSLMNLASVLGEGPDLRITRRPMLGIFLSDFNAEIATHLGIPVSQGVRLEDVLAGMGAQKAGLQSNDVITNVDGHEVKEFADLRDAITGHHAGDVLKVIYYRGSELREAEMPLSGRRIDPVLSSPAALADKVAAGIAAGFAELEALLADVTDDEASHQPEPGEWSVKEILAHLVLSERGAPHFMTEMIGRQEQWSDGFFGNQATPLQALLAVYPTVPALLRALHEASDETVAFLRYLPADMVANKAFWWRICFNYQDFITHISQHLDQLRAALESAHSRQPVA